ncbi:MAG: cytochrome c biogenesis protein CcsA [Proteobacteria bacterium]|nr:cytochrome c biogenesis protein CcsA [Pseudomonadota bacterium]
MAPILTYSKAFLGQLLFVFIAIFYFLSLVDEKRRRFCLKYSSFGLIASYLLLTFCFSVSDFTLKVVASHSHLKTPLLFKIVAVWGSGEGAFLLWAMLLSFTGFILETRVAQIFFGFHMLAIVLLQIFIMHPFTTHVGLSVEDLNPLLQDHSMVFHPPILYMGQIFWGMIFFKMLDSPFDIKKIMNLLRLGFFALMVGISLGCYWAYYVLGWGGFWYWDPVEVISLFGLLFYVLCFHIVKFKRFEGGGYLYFAFGWPITLLGSFLIRSGVLNSVHSFAQNLDFILFAGVVFMLTILPALFVMIQKRPIVEEQSKLTFFEMACLIIWWGIFLTLLLTVIIPLFFKDISFGPPFFARSVWPLSIMGLLLMGWVPLKWSWHNRVNILLKSIFCSFIFLLFLCFLSDFSILIILTLTCGLCSSIITFYVCYCVKRSPSLLMGHIGFILMMVSATLTTFLSFEERITFSNDKEKCSAPLKNGDRIEVLDSKAYENNNHIVHEVSLIWIDQKGNPYHISPEFKYFFHLQTTKSEMAFKLNGWHQKGAVIEKMTEDTLQVFVFEKKYILLFWMSLLLMMMSILRGILKRVKFLKSSR